MWNTISIFLPHAQCVQGTAVTPLSVYFYSNRCATFRSRSMAVLLCGPSIWMTLLDDSVDREATLFWHTSAHFLILVSFLHNSLDLLVIRLQISSAKYLKSVSNHRQKFADIMPANPLNNKYFFSLPPSSRAAPAALHHHS